MWMSLLKKVVVKIEFVFRPHTFFSFFYITPETHDAKKMNFSVTTVFTPMERAEMKKRFHLQKKTDAQNQRVGQQAAKYYKSTVEVKRFSRRRLVSASTAGVQAEENLQQVDEETKASFS